MKIKFGNERQSNIVEKELIGKTIEKIEIDGYGITMVTEDGLCLDYYASDGGYSSWEITKNEAL